MYTQCMHQSYLDRWCCSTDQSMVCEAAQQAELTSWLLNFSPSSDSESRFLAPLSTIPLPTLFPWMRWLLLSPSPHLPIFPFTTRASILALCQVLAADTFTLVFFSQLGHKQDEKPKLAAHMFRRWNYYQIDLITSNNAVIYSVRYRHTYVQRVL